MMSLSEDTQADIIESFTSGSRYLDDLFNIDSPYSEGMVIQIYSYKLQFNKANSTDTEAAFFDLHLLISKVFFFFFFFFFM